MSICTHYRERQQTVERAYWATKGLLKENPRITAMVMVHHSQAVGARALQELNRKVPDDCSIIGALIGVETRRSTAPAPR